MKRFDLSGAWHRFWFAQQPATPVALFRILFGLHVLVMGFVELLPNFYYFYGVKSIVSDDSVVSFWWRHQPEFDLLLPQSDLLRMFLFVVFLIAAFFLTIGFRSRLSAVVVYLLVLSMHRHCPVNLDAGDLFMRLMALLLCFSHCGDAFSLDSLITNAKKDWRQVGFQTPLSKPWAQRLMQVQMTITYFHSFLSKIEGPLWRGGQAVYWSTRFVDLIRFPCPLVTDNFVVSSFMTYYTLVIEFSLFTLVWFKRCRYWILLGGLILHGGIDWCLILPGFETLYMSSYILFVEPDDLAKAFALLKQRSRKVLGEQVSLAYNGTCICCVRLVGTLHRLDVFEQMKLIDFEQTGVQPNSNAGCLILESKDGNLSGFALVSWLVARLPLLWPTYLLVKLAGRCKPIKRALLSLFVSCQHVISPTGICKNSECCCGQSPAAN